MALSAPRPKHGTLDPDEKKIDDIEKERECHFRVAEKMMSGPYLYRDEKLLHHGFIVASLIYGAMLQRSVRFPDIGGVAPRES